MGEQKQDGRIRILVYGSAIGIFLLVVLFLIAATTMGKPSITQSDHDSWICTGWAYDPSWGYFNCREVDNNKPSK